MTKDDRPKITIDKEKEMRTRETSRMINEGGLGARTHYDIKKESSSEKTSQKSNPKNKNTQNKQDKNSES